jgi:hypothetical protein
LATSGTIVPSSTSAKTGAAGIKVKAPYRYPDSANILTPVSSHLRHPDESRDPVKRHLYPVLAVIPTKVGIQLKNIFYWMPVFTGMTDEWMPFAGTTALPFRHPDESRDPVKNIFYWMPVFTGMTAVFLLGTGFRRYDGLLAVIPTKVGIQLKKNLFHWVPAFAGMTEGWRYRHPDESRDPVKYKIFRFLGCPNFWP